MQVFESLAGLLAELDVLLSFADLASSCPTPYTRPDITPSVIVSPNYLFFSFLAMTIVFLVCVIIGFLLSL